MFVRPLRILAIVATSVALSLSALPSDAQPSDAAPAHGRPHYYAKAADAAGWQATQLNKGVIHNGQYDFDDWGLTVDTAFALAAVGNRPQHLDRVTRAIAKHYYSSYVALGGDFVAGATAKTLLVAKVVGRKPRHFGGHNVRALLLDLVAPDTEGFEAGRVRDTGVDYSNTFAQAYAVLGLARTGGVPQDVVDYLVKQRCGDGYFRLTEVAGESCNTGGSAPDVDATALAVQALKAADTAGADVPAHAVSKAAAWLVSVQASNGSFRGGTTTPSRNSNSTGLAAQALKVADRVHAAKRAAAFVATLQITDGRATRPARKDIGAIAYNRAGLKAGLKNGIQLVERDQFRRATAQAIFAFVPIPLGRLSAP